MTADTKRARELAPLVCSIAHDLVDLEGEGQLLEAADTLRSLADEVERLRCVVGSEWDAVAADKLLADVEQLRADVEQATTAALRASVHHAASSGRVLQLDSEVRRLRSRQLPDELREEAHALILSHDQRWMVGWRRSVVDLLRRIAAIGEGGSDGEH